MDVCVVVSVLLLKTCITVWTEEKFYKEKSLKTNLSLLYFIYCSTACLFFVWTSWFVFYHSLLLTVFFMSSQLMQGLRFLYIVHEFSSGIHPILERLVVLLLLFCQSGSGDWFFFYFSGPLCIFAMMTSVVGFQVLLSDHSSFVKSFL